MIEPQQKKENKYIRDKNCECANLVESNCIITDTINGKLTIMPRWYKGYIHNDDDSKVKECSCHRKWRIKNLINSIFLESFNIDISELENLVYKDFTGKNSFNKLMSLFNKYRDNESNLNGKYFYLYGGVNTQKTTSALQLLKLFLEEKYINNNKKFSGYYTTYSELLGMFIRKNSFRIGSEEEEKVNNTLNEIKASKLLIIDNFCDKNTGYTNGVYSSKVLSQFEDLLLSKLGFTVLVFNIENRDEIQSLLKPIFSQQFYGKVLSSNYLEFDNNIKKNGLLTDIENGEFWD